MGDTPSPPEPQNPAITAAQQQTLNQQATKDAQAASMVNQVTPQGTLNYNQTGVGPDGIPTYTATQTLSPQQQAIFNQLQGAQTTASGQAGNVLAGANYGQPGSNNIVGDTNSITSQLMNNETSFLQPFFNQQTSWLDNQMRNQGLAPGAGTSPTSGGTAYGNGMQNLQANQGQTVSGFLAQAEPQAFNQALTQYQLPANMAAILEGLSQTTPINQSTTATPQASMTPANLIQATGQAQQMQNTAYQSQLQNQASMMSGLFGGLGAIGGGFLGNPKLATIL